MHEDHHAHICFMCHTVFALVQMHAFYEHNCSSLDLKGRIRVAEGAASIP